MIRVVRVTFATIITVQLSCVFGLRDITNGQLEGQVVASGPVADARVQVWRLDESGQRLGLVGEATTDTSGAWSVDIDWIAGAIAIEASGGTFTEPWAPERMIAIDPAGAPLRAVIMDYFSGSPAHVVVTPYTTIAAALGDAWLAKEQIGPYGTAQRRAYELVGAHLGGKCAELGAISLVDHGPLPMTTPAQNLDPSTRHALMLAALSSLAERMAAESSTSALTVNTVQLTRALVRDAQDGIFDGIGPAGTRLRIGSTACPAALCDLDANTLRAELATALAFYLLPSPRNWTGLELDEVRPWIEAIWMNDEPLLFGGEPIEPLGGEPPTIEVQPTSIYDEAMDSIEFTATAEPIHTVSGLPVVLDGSEVCPTVHKYVTRMDDPMDNPLRWEFVVTDRRGVGIEPAGGEYRVGIRGQGDVMWLTDWRHAIQLGSVENGYQYEVLLTRSALPELATTQATFQLEFRGGDSLAHATPVARACWQHVPLAAPLYVSEAREVPASDPWSLHSVGIGNGLAPLLNGVSLAEGKAIMEFDIKNGTDEPVYVTLDVDQPIATYTKSWQKTNAYLFTHPAPSNCLMAGTCTLGLPPDRKTTVVQDAPGTIVSVVTGIVVTEALTGMMLESCGSCGPNGYRIEARESDTSPRVYRVRLVVTDLDELAPLPASDMDGPYQDVLLEPLELPVLITGYRYGRLGYCARQNDVNPTMCDEHREYVHYLALLEASLIIDSISVSARARAAAGLAAQDVPGLPIQIAQYTWASQQIAPLPSPWPSP